jgi:hypothetical protein
MTAGNLTFTTDQPVTAWAGGNVQGVCVSATGGTASQGCGTVYSNNGGTTLVITITSVGGDITDSLSPWAIYENPNIPGLGCANGYSYYVNPSTNQPGCYQLTYPSNPDAPACYSSANGLPVPCTHLTDAVIPTVNPNTVIGPGSGATVGHLAVMGNTGGTSITDGGAVPTINPDTVTGPGSGATVGHLAVMGNTGGTSITDGGAVPAAANLALTGFTAGPGTVTASDTVTTGLQKVAANATINQATGTSVTLTAPTQIYTCSGACAVTAPTPPASGTSYDFCVENNVGVTSIITVAMPLNVTISNTAKSAYSTASTSGTTHGIASTGAAGDRLCFHSVSATAYNTDGWNGTWTVY